MNRSEDEERTPLVYEDRVGSSSFMEADAGRRRCRRYICIALTTVCVGVCLVLAVALPITLSQGGKAATNPRPLLAKSGLRAFHEPSSESVATHAFDWFSSGRETESPTTDSMQTPSSSSSSASSGSLSSSSLSVFSPSNTPSVSTDFSTPSTEKPPDPFASCNDAPPGRRSAIDLDQLNGMTFFELYRVQTRNSPGYASGLSCSVMEIDFENSTRASLSKNGTMKLKWLERGFISRYPGAIDANLERSEDSPNDWTETFGNQSDAKGRLSLLAQIDGYLLTYECFPNVRFYRSPAYVIHLYSIDPWPGNTYVSTFLMDLADSWGLNPVEERRTSISHRFCSLENVPR